MKKTIVIADADEQFCKELEAELTQRDTYEVVGIANDGETAVQLVREQWPDVLVLDLMLSKQDGLSVLKAIHGMERRPAVFATSGFITDFVASAAANLGVRYLMLKPCPAQNIVDRIDEAWRQEDAPIEQKVPDIKREITAMIHDIGVPANIKGYHYLRDAIRLAAENIDRINNMTEYIYKPVALLNNTTPDCVQRAILKAIEIAWDRGDLDILQSFFGYTVSNTKGRPTNSEFIALLADKIRLWMEENADRLKCF